MKWYFNDFKSSHVMLRNEFGTLGCCFSNDCTNNYLPAIEEVVAPFTSNEISLLIEYLQNENITCPQKLKIAATAIAETVN